MLFTRILDLHPLVKKKSLFLFGPRATGKSTLLKETMGNQALYIDLLQARIYQRLLADPSELEAMVTGNKLVIIDEVQRIPELLNTVHRLIESTSIRFVLTGSSARKIKRGRANLLAGRAWSTELFPLVWAEQPDFKLNQALRYGSLPVILQSDDPDEELFAYTNTYLKEEIQAEGLVRKLANFARFLKTAALWQGTILNFEKLGNLIGLSASTVREHYRILEDTLVGYLVEPWQGANKRKPVSTAKFYLFDIGVTHTLSGTRNLDRNSDLYGKSFEHFIGLELRAYLSYRRIRESLMFWRTKHGAEVDFIVEGDLAVEVKATKSVTPDDLKGLKLLQEEKAFKSLILVSQDPVTKTVQGIKCFYWETFLKELWSDRFIR